MISSETGFPLTEQIKPLGRNILRTYDQNLEIVRAGIREVASKGALANFADIHEESMTEGVEERLSRKIQNQKYNPVTMLQREDSARLNILDRIVSEVIIGDNELGIAEFDMDELKGFNDKYGEDEADKILKAWAENMLKAADELAEKSDYYYAVMNVHGESSDSVKIIFIGKALQSKIKDTITHLVNNPAQVDMINREGMKETEKVSFGCGYQIMSEEMRDALKIMEINDRFKAGDLYTSISQEAKVKLEGSKSFDEASLVNELLSAENVETLDQILDSKVLTMARVPQILIKTYRDQRKKIRK